ncbi:MAG: 50S ribosomal protein L2 [Candidatus Magasanikbacteria bacterium RIFCSPLOWO2_01_FULL_43_20b]|nr:MAG: 50S ribosomal protein L2 [Candidatus Magasanikbacteria bacterium RIFCSPHIGHO2_02_FULL_44_13]OGH71893.1 MAG: 50S ribosomal protein L2 [Candidatus Magasanikbacteria bacterium RIFCSPLOWO2_02_FULL_43_22]OGH73529.1 MAG: 50S ribosomal protein L2 [Candidatus Magasanikbacteria bacterium RIFCSPLOWO2_01_FULL_43_20b]
MPIKIYKPTTAARRKSSVQDFSDITKVEPEKSLVVNLQRKSGRNNTGKITVRHQGGGVKRLYRLVDFKQHSFDLPAEVKAIEYDPNRGARIMLVEYADKEKSYLLAPQGIKIGETIMSSRKKIEAKVGNRMPLEEIPVGLFVYNVELTPGKGGQIVRGAGNGAQFQVIEGEYAQLKLPSGEVRMVQKNCLATIGQVSNPDYNLIRWGKAGRIRKRGIRPTVKGKNMNPVDHPHGGGEGHSPIGLKGGPKTMWGKKARGVKTRKPQKWSDKFVLKKRKGTVK